jgi:microcin C transport system permease protein
MTASPPKTLFSLYYGAFRRNRLALWSGRLLCVLILLSLGANVIANDKPLVMQHQGRILFPMIVSYTEKDLGGTFETPADFHDPFVQGLIHNGGGWMVWPLVPFSYDTLDMDLREPVPAPPSARHLLGTDDQGRDVLARLLYGMQMALVFALTLTAISSVVGIVLGGIQGYFGGAVDMVLQRMIEIWSSLPILYILIILSGLVVPSFGWILLIMLLFKWMALVAVVRAECLKVRKQPYIVAAVTQGHAPLKILFSHVLPNALVAAFTFLPFQMTGAIETLAVLDLLGFGLPPGSPSLGEMILQGKNNLQAPWLALSAFVSMAALLSLLIFVGDGLRRACNPEEG